MASRPERPHVHGKPARPPPEVSGRALTLAGALQPPRVVVGVVAAAAPRPRDVWATRSVPSASPRGHLAKSRTNCKFAVTIWLQVEVNPQINCLTSEACHTAIWFLVASTDPRLRQRRHTGLAVTGLMPTARSPSAQPIGLGRARPNDRDCRKL